jgi:glycerate 2-kinase
VAFVTVESDLSAILRGGLEAVDPARRVAEALADDPWSATWAADIAHGRGRTMLVAVGKAALGMARGAVAVLGDALDEGVILTPEGSDEPHGSGLPPALEVRVGGHPLPTAEGAEAAARIAELVESAGAGDRLLVLLSGGGSALLSLPAEGLTVDDLAGAADSLLRAGLPIGETNLVRRHLERLKGGGLARRAAAGQVLGLILSDVPGDDPGVVASGPLTAEASAPRDAETLLRRRGLWNDLPGAVQRYLTGQRSAPPSGPLPGEDRLRVRVIAGGGRALEGAAAVARRLGYRTHVLSGALVGEARRAGRGLARVGLAVRDGVGPVRPPACLLAAGETTVEVVGSGLGGRNQEVALAAAIALEGEEGVVVASLGTDGVDGPTDAAGGWADGTTATRGRAAGLDPAEALAANDAYTFLDAAGGLLRTGPTGTNVADLMVVLVRRG